MNNTSGTQYMAADPRYLIAAFSTILPTLHSALAIQNNDLAALGLAGSVMSGGIFLGHALSENNRLTQTFKSHVPIFALAAGLFLGATTADNKREIGFSEFIDKQNSLSITGLKTAKLTGFMLRYIGNQLKKPSCHQCAYAS